MTDISNREEEKPPSTSKTPIVQITVPLAAPAPPIPVVPAAAPEAVVALAQIITPPGSLIPSPIQSNEVTPRQSFTTETYQNSSGENANIESDTDPIPPTHLVVMKMYNQNSQPRQKSSFQPTSYSAKVHSPFLTPINGRKSYSSTRGIRKSI